MIDIILGGQGGDEGKGKIASYLAKKRDYTYSLRISSPQAGHSVYINNQRVALSHIPCAVVNPDIKLILGAASFISPERLFYGEESTNLVGEVQQIQSEISTFNLTPERLFIDYRAKLVTKEHKQKERENQHLMHQIGSVGSGINQARKEFLERDEKVKFVTDDLELSQFTADTEALLQNALAKNESVLFETDHGSKLCQHFGEYPYTTARTINASSFLGEAGLPPKYVRDVILVLKPYTTRVGPGPLENEIMDKDILDEMRVEGGETGSISGRPRRIGLFEFENIKKVIARNAVTIIAITHMDLSLKVWNALNFQDDQDFLWFFNTLWYDKKVILSYGPGVDCEEYN